MTKEFDNEILEIEKRIKVIEELGSVNSQLMKYNWVFLHPYSQGMDIGIIRRLLNEDSPEERILDFFGKKFFGLRSTIHFTDGLFKQRPFLKDFSLQIEESVVLCLQKDFRGAISILIPVIEGVLRNFLVQEKGDSWKTNTSKRVFKESFSAMTDVYVELCRTYLKKRYEPLVKANKYFTEEQESKILEAERQYFELWVGQLNQYLERNLYHDTRQSEPDDLLNRHVIYHAFNYPVDFSFSNYLRLFNCISYISWAIGSVTYESKPFSEEPEVMVFEKYKSYLKILVVSEGLTQTKSTLFGRKIESFKRFLNPLQNSIIVRPKYEMLRALQIIDELKLNPFEKSEWKVTRKPGKGARILINFLKFVTRSKRKDLKRE